MDDDFPKEFPRVWVAAGIFLAAIILAFFMVVFTSIRAEAQEQPLCAPLGELTAQLKATYNETPIWGATEGQGPQRLVLYQSPDGKTWTLVRLMSPHIGCFIAGGKDAILVQSGKGV